MINNGRKAVKMKVELAPEPSLDSHSKDQKINPELSQQTKLTGRLLYGQFKLSENARASSNQVQVC